jgi:hypothetical protein
VNKVAGTTLHVPLLGCERVTVGGPNFERRVPV